MEGHVIHDKTAGALAFRARKDHVTVEFDDEGKSSEYGILLDMDISVKQAKALRDWLNRYLKEH